MHQMEGRYMRPSSFLMGFWSLAERGDERLHIEVIAYKSSGPARAKDFYEAFFRAISRIDDGATECVIAMAAQAEMGLPARARQHGSSWKRIGQSFMSIFSLAGMLQSSPVSATFRQFRVQRCRHSASTKPELFPLLEVHPTF